MGDIFLIAFFSVFSFWIGYNYPRDVERCGGLPQ